jgi:hypothetical protein
MVNCIRSGKEFIAGFSPPLRADKKGIFLGNFALLDMVGVGVVSAGFLELGIPLTCTGRNLLYSRKVFAEVGGYERIKNFVSGDDDLLMHLISQNKYRCGYSWNPETVVPTEPPDSWRDFFQARLRHSSKSFSYPWRVKLILFWIYLTHLLPIVMIFWGIFSLSVLKFSLVALLIKIFGDLLLVQRFTRKMGINVNWSFSVLASILHLFYVIIVPIFGNFRGFQWKDTHYHRSLSD